MRARPGHSQFIVAAALLMFSNAAIAQTPPGAATQAAAPAGPATQATAPVGAPLGLDAALSMAMASNPHLIAARLKKPADVAGIDVAAERPNPEFSYELGRDTPRHSFTLVFPLELGGKRARRIDLARATVTSGDAAIKQAEFQVQNDVRRAYFELAAAEARAVAAADLRGLSVRARDAAQARLSLGDAPRLELLQAELILSSADNDLTTATAGAAANRAALNTLLGRAAATPVTTSEALGTRALPTEEAALARANAVSVELAAIDAEISEQTARRALAKALQTPDASAGAGFTSGVPDEFNFGWRFSAGVTVPLFTRHKAGVLVEDAELTRLRAERTAVLADIAGNVAEARARAAAAEAQLDRFEKDILPHALEVERMAEDSYRSGQTNLAALLQSLQSSRELRFRALDAGLDYQRALADVERAIGAAIK